MMLQLIVCFAPHASAIYVHAHLASTHISNGIGKDVAMSRADMYAAVRLVGAHCTAHSHSVQ